MGCGLSKTTNGLSGIEFSMIELSIARRPGGADVGPVCRSPASVSPLNKVSTPEHSDNFEIESEPALEEETTSSKKLPISVLVFSIVKVAPDENGVMFYHFSGTSAEKPTHQVRIAKRFSDFKALHLNISELMANERNVPLSQQHLFETHPALPELPKANAWTYLQGRSSEKVLEDRELQFTRILNAISRHPVAFHSQPFTNFLERQ